jgi:threonine dehydrogenase-like Zn-dependent dehydrogenase
MRAVVLRDGRLDVREVADPAPGSGEVLLRTLSTAICASDVHFMDHPEMGINDPTGRSLCDADRDIVLGHEFVGEVVGYGPDCTEQFPVGTRVTSIPIRVVNGGADGVRIIGQHPEAQGSFGELVVVAETLAKPVDGDVPVVIGAGAIGLSAVAALAGRGIEPIIVSDYNSERRELACASFGAHIAVDPVERSPFDVWREVRVERGMWGPMVVFECVGAAGLIQRIVDSVDIGTRIYCAGGWYSGDSLSITDATRQGVTIQFGGGPHPQDWYGTLDAIAAGQLDPLPSVGAVVGLDEVPDALDSARKSTGPARIIVHPNGDVK